MTAPDATEHRQFAQGVAEFNAGHYWEAHETWECIWAEEVGERRLCLQALVQLAAGFHKAEIGVPGGARKLWSSALRILQSERDDAWGIDVAKLRHDLARVMTADLRDPIRIEVRPA
ncbi:MAG: DUF309 domain-containing protein [Candidatus Binatia bacterium]